MQYTVFNIACSPKLTLTTAPCQRYGLSPTADNIAAIHRREPEQEATSSYKYYSGTKSPCLRAPLSAVFHQYSGVQTTVWLGPMWLTLTVRWLKRLDKPFDSFVPWQPFSGVASSGAKSWAARPFTGAP
jgi:hypothetical protein